MKSFPVKCCYRYWFSWILVFVVTNCLIILFIQRNQILNSQSAKDEELMVLSRRVKKVMNEAKSDIKLQNDLMNKFMRIMDTQKRSVNRAESIKKIQNINNNISNALAIIDNNGSSKLPTSRRSFTQSHDNLLQISTGNNCPRNVVIPILIITCNRPTGLQRTLVQLLNLRQNLTAPASPSQFPIYISQGCQHDATKNIINEYKSSLAGTFSYKQNDLALKKLLKNKRLLGYFKISDHYKVAIDWLFALRNFSSDSTDFHTEFGSPNTNYSRSNYEQLIIVEDDLDIAPDFYNYFHATSTLLRNDRSLFCVSSWNDNGKLNLIDSSASATLYRTDFFPGLGWMMLRSLWLEIRDSWPNSFWDEYLRDPAVRQNRQCIRPEIARTATFGRKGVSNGQFYDKHLRYLMLNNVSIDFCRLNLTLLGSNELYDRYWHDLVYFKSTKLTISQFLTNKSLPDFVRIEYTTNKHFSQIAKNLSLMDDLKSGVPRTAYKGVVTFYRSKTRVFISPPESWTHYKT